MRFVLPVLLAAGCVVDHGEPPEPALEARADAWDAPRRRADAGAGEAPAPMWSRCDDAECATLSVPLSWDAPSGPGIVISVKRYPARTQPASGQLWLLQGGPGGAAERLEPAVDTFRDIAPGFDVYLPDHRGVGGSTRLGCGVFSEEAVGPRCGMALKQKWGNGLDDFTVTAAARDLALLLERTGHPRQRVFLYGVSYGTYWAHRFLQLRPDVVDGVVLDSICPPGTCSYPHYDRSFDAVGRDYLALCAGDPACAARLGPDPAARATRIVGGLSGGRCHHLADRRDALKRLFAALLAGWNTRVMVPALLHRLDRCAAGDAEILGALLDQLGDAVPPDVGPDSVALQYHVLLSELWWPALSAEAVERIDAGLVFATRGPLWAARLRSSWPTYRRDALAGLWAETSVPMLMLSGTLDPQTPPGIAAAAGERFLAPGQHYVQVPWAAHGVVFQSPTVDGTQCGAELMADFVRDPAQVDLACLRRLRRPEFEGADAARDFLGIDDLWDGALGEDEGVDLVSDEAVRRRWDDLRRRRAWLGYGL